MINCKAQARGGKFNKMVGWEGGWGGGKAAGKTVFCLGERFLMFVGDFCFL